MFQVLRRVFQLMRGQRARGQGLFLLLMVSLVVTYGAVGFYYFEGPTQPELRPGDAVWWSVVTMTTVGYGDYFPRTWQGRWLVSVPVMVLGIGVLGYAIGVLTTVVLERHGRKARGMLSYSKAGHVLVCHHPSEDAVLAVVEEIRADDHWRDRDIVVVTDRLAQLGEGLLRSGAHFVSGHPSREATLEQAGVARAHRVVILSQEPGDAATDNQTLGVLVTVRALNPEVYVVAECVAKENAKLLERAGANEVVGLSSLAAGLVVQGMQDPGVNGLIAELVTNKAGHQFYFEPVTSFRGTFAALEQELLTRGRYVVLGLVGPEGRRLLPERDALVASGQRVMLIGTHRPGPL